MRSIRQTAVQIVFASSLAGAAVAQVATPPHAASVSVLTATKACFPDTLDVSGVIIPGNEVAIRPERPGMRVSDVLVDAGESVTANQTLARLTPAEGGAAINVTASAAGLISKSTAIVGTIASARGEALFSLIPRSEFELVAQVPTRELGRLVANQKADVFVVGADKIEGRVRQTSPVIEPNTQLGRVFITLASGQRLIANAFGRASITLGESCGIALPLSAILYSNDGTVAQVVRNNRIETRRIEPGLMKDGRVEIRSGITEGDVIVARSGALLREGDPVNPVTSGAPAK